VRDFDVVARTAESEFVVLLPEPGDAPDERVAALARGVADDVRKDERLNEPVRVSLAFGHAVLGPDGATRESLLARTMEPRIRMV
jgi:GGDEF domain-containing protein